MMNGKVRGTRPTMFAIFIIGLIVPTIAWTPTRGDYKFPFTDERIYRMSVESG